jgi:uncharacterized protein YhfF/GNAT superfamily N-acetyltransferase
VNALDPTVAKDFRVQSFWEDFCRQIRLPSATAYQAWYFGDTPELAHELVELVLRGPKRGTAGLAWVMDALPHAAPVAGGFSVVTEFDGTPRAVIRTTSVGRKRFGDVDAQFAWDEGEDDRSLESWRAGHQRYFGRECERLGRVMSDDVPVVLERFELVYPFDRALDPVACGPRILPVCIPGGLEQSAALQIAYYARCHGFSEAFAIERQRDIAQFTQQHDAARDGVWLLVDGGRVAGSIVIDARGRIPELRWYIVDERLHGQGWGRRLMAAAIAHCCARHPRIELHTFTALSTARALYDAFGFRQVGGDASYGGYGPTIIEQHFEWTRQTS